MKTPNKLDFTTVSKRLDDKTRTSYVEEVKQSYWSNFNTALTLKENFIVWAHEVQKMPYYEIAPIFDLKKSQIGNIYNEIKNRKEMK